MSKLVAIIDNGVFLEFLTDDPDLKIEVLAIDSEDASPENTIRVDADEYYRYQGIEAVTFHNEERLNKCLDAIHSQTAR